MKRQCLDGISPLVTGAGSGRGRLVRLVRMGLLGLFLAPSAWAEPALGRLFFSPEQRAKLDDVQIHPPTSGPETPAPVRQRLDGVVRIGNGKSLVFVDGKVQADSGAPAGVKVGEYFEAAGTPAAAPGNRSGP